MNYDIYQLNKADNGRGYVNGERHHGLLEVTIPSDGSLAIIHEIDYHEEVEAP